MIIFSVIAINEMLSSINNDQLYGIAIFIEINEMLNIYSYTPSGVQPMGEQEMKICGVH